MPNLSDVAIDALEKYKKYRAETLNSSAQSLIQRMIDELKEKYKNDIDGRKTKNFLLEKAAGINFGNLRTLLEGVAKERQIPANLQPLFMKHQPRFFQSAPQAPIPTETPKPQPSMTPSNKGKN